MVSELLNYIQKVDIKNQKFLFTEHKLIINTTPLNFNLIADYCLLIICIFLTSKIGNDKEFILLVITLWIIVALCIWRDFQYVNVTVIDFKEQKISIRSKNLIKRLF